MARMRKRKDPVTYDTAREVLRRDGYECAAPRVAREIGEEIDRCRAMWGQDMNGTVQDGRAVGYLTLDHVRDGPMMGKRAPSDIEHLVTLCYHHHLDGWATSHRPALRDYLASFYQSAPATVPLDVCG